MKANATHNDGEKDQSKSMCPQENEEEISFLHAESSEMSLIWSNLSYTIRERDICGNVRKLNAKYWFKYREKIILHQQNGFLTTGCLMCIIGKSGSGKTTLIEILSGRRNFDAGGDIQILVKAGAVLKCGQINIGYVSQNDHLIEFLTVKESISFASRLKNYDKSSLSHEKSCQELLDQLDLQDCKNVRSSNISGGQRKRLCIAIELVSNPTILLIDEPTSGLDSSSAYQCVRLLKNLTLSKANPKAILVSIHQPSAKTLEEFHKSYILSHDGKCIYFGPNDKLVNYFARFNLRCPQFHNPADYAIEIASADYGEYVIKQMESAQLLQAVQTPTVASKNSDFEKIKLSSVITSMTNHSALAFWLHTKTLIHRSLLTTFRNPALNYLRILVHIFIALVIILLYGSESGSENGCSLFDSGSGVNNLIFENILQKHRNISENLSFLLFSIVFLMLANSTQVLVYPLEARVILKERSNGQVNDYWRFFSFCLICILIAFTGQSLSQAVGALFIHNILAAAFAVPMITLPFVLLCGFFVKADKVNFLLRPTFSISFVRYAYEALLITVYGFGRCDFPYGEQLANNSSESVFQVLNRFSKFMMKLDLNYASARELLVIRSLSK
ncbi:ABC transporter sub-family G-like protein 1, partial [Dinothrombium tinctorium]